VCHPSITLSQAEYLAVGEGPEELRNVLRQRSRWTKGHMQVRDVCMI
jgi:cellulose synthase/poly-beta-1,6-N-acetylglucosamine synthase-like glycosyltransferase